MAITLYELTEDMIELETLIEEDLDNEQKEHFEEILQIIKNEVEHKSGNIIKLLLSIEADVKTIDMEIKRLQALKKKNQNKTESIKEMVKECMSKAEIKSIKTTYGNITLVKPQPSVAYADVDLLEDTYKNIKTEIKPNKKAILAHFNETGEILPGVEIVHKHSLRFPKLKEE